MKPDGQGSAPIRLPELQNNPESVKISPLQRFYDDKKGNIRIYKRRP